MLKRALAVHVLASLLCGCAQTPSAEPVEKPELSDAEKALVLEQAPSDIAHPMYIDFNGKAELVGYDLSSSGVAAPGSSFTLKLYWRASSGSIGDGYVPFTQLVTPGGKRFEVQGASAIRMGTLAPAHWERGKVYVDELTASVPADIDAGRFDVVVGFRTQPIAPEEPEAPADADKAKDAKDAKDAKPAGTFGPVYLSVVSGPAAAQFGGVVATLETGLTREKIAEMAAARAAAAKRVGTKPLQPAKQRPAAPAQ